jgi:hypothetical protein
MENIVFLTALIFVAAVLYSSVGHAGASGYLAAMALVGVAPEPGLEDATIVRPDGYVAGRGAPGEEARLLDLLAKALET